VTPVQPRRVEADSRKRPDLQGSVRYDGIVPWPLSHVGVETKVILPNPAWVICGRMAEDLAYPGHGAQFAEVAPEDTAGRRSPAAIGADRGKPVG